MGGRGEPYMELKGGLSFLQGEFRKAVEKDKDAGSKQIRLVLFGVLQIGRQLTRPPGFRRIAPSPLIAELQHHQIFLQILFDPDLRQTDGQ